MDVRKKRLIFLKTASLLSLLSCVALPVACGAKENTGDGDTPVFGNGSSGNGAFSANNASAGSGASTGNCADKTVATSRAPAWVLFVIDRSQTMNDSFGNTTRWQAVYDTLMAPNSGVIPKLQNEVYFGIMLFDGLGTCPRLETVPPALKNYDKINALYGPAVPGQRTPTALALNAAYKTVPSQQQMLDSPGIGQRQYVVLCTDGEPNGCDSSKADFEGPKNEVTTAANNGIKTFVVSVASSGAEYQTYLDDLAKIGNTGSPAFSPTTKDDLVEQLGGIIGNAIGCQVQLNGRVVVGMECSGKVVLNSKNLVCNDANGWKLVDESHIELRGTACKTFMNDSKAIINASFPCGTVNIL